MENEPSAGIACARPRTATPRLKLGQCSSGATSATRAPRPRLSSASCACACLEVLPGRRPPADHHCRRLLSQVLELCHATAAFSLLALLLRTHSSWLESEAQAVGQHSRGARRLTTRRLSVCPNAITERRGCQTRAGYQPNELAPVMFGLSVIIIVVSSWSQGRLDGAAQKSRNLGHDLAPLTEIEFCSLQAFKSNNKQFATTLISTSIQVLPKFSFCACVPASLSESHDFPVVSMNKLICGAKAKLDTSQRSLRFWQSNSHKHDSWMDCSLKIFIHIHNSEQLEKILNGQDNFNVWFIAVRNAALSRRPAKRRRDDALIGLR